RAMRRSIVLAGVALAFTSTLAFAAPESLLPDVFDNPAPTPAPAPRPAPAPGPDTAPAQPGADPVIQPLPGIATAPTGPAPRVELPSDFLTLAELEEMDQGEIDELLGLKPKFDIPPAARRAVREVGVIAPDEGGFPTG